MAESIRALLQNAAEQNDGYYDNADMKRMLNISDKTLYRWRKQRMVNFVKMGGKFFYPKSTMRQLRSQGKGRK